MAVLRQRAEPRTVASICGKEVMDSLGLLAAALAVHMPRKHFVCLYRYLSLASAQDYLGVWRSGGGKSRILQNNS